jgi:hypothetical protein
MEFVVIKEYAGIEVGSIVKFSDKQTEQHMIDKGYVKMKSKRAKKVEPTKRKKKIEPINRKIK